MGNFGRFTAYRVNAEFDGAAFWDADRFGVIHVHGSGYGLGHIASNREGAREDDNIGLGRESQTTMKRWFIVLVLVLAALSGVAGAQDRATATFTINVGHITTLTWDAVTVDDSGAPYGPGPGQDPADIISYNVYRSTTNGGPYTALVTGLMALDYTDTSVVDGTTYFYVVSATNSVGTSGYSNQAVAVVP